MRVAIVGGGEIHALQDVEPRGLQQDAGALGRDARHRLVDGHFAPRARQQHG